jgi:hypothetical protein
MEDLIGFAYFTVIFMTFGLITGACLMRRLDSLSRAIDEHAEKFID